ncbi:MAG: group II intron reverse transcriptase/maturase [Burkholderiaceae bacterium]
MNKAKPFCISKHAVWAAYKRVKANQGAAGVDGQSIAQFEESLKSNLYKLWNRMSSGSYMPPAVRRVDIPKDGKGTRQLGIPTVADRIAQAVVKEYLEPELEKHFHDDSYGYRPGKSAIDAVGVARERCWRYDWVLDLDIRGFFDHINHALLMRAVRKHTDCPWVLLYIERWLAAPIEQVDGSVVVREEGTPQGGVISPLLANLFLHYAFDKWMERHCSYIRFERYADDIICHCRNEAQAKRVYAMIEKRFVDCGLELHPEKSQVAYCRDVNRRKDYPVIQFDFLGYTFRPRRSTDRFGRYYVNFLPAVSNKAAKAMRQRIRRWALHRRVDKSLNDIARMFNPVLRGWINYYGRYYRSELHKVFGCLDRRLARWAQQKYKRLRRHQRRATRWLASIQHKQRSLFAHWRLA